jgi:hypothetical protein
METFWQDRYKSTATEIPHPDQESLHETTNEFFLWQNRNKKSTTVQDEYIRYIRAPVISEVTDPKAWWLEPTQQKTYPNLSKMALDILSIPAMSAEPERLFSGAGITITDRRNRLQSEAIEALECLKSWLGKSHLEVLREGVVDQS